MGRDTECDQRLASVPLTQSGLHASALVEGSSERMPVYVCFCEKQLALGTAKAVISSRGTVHVSTLWTLKAIRSWILVALQGAQVANKTGKVLGAHLIRIRRHRVSRHNFKFAKIRLLKRPELVVAVHHLNGETIVPQKSSRNRLSIACYQFDGPILGTNIFLRRHERGPYFVPGPPRSNRGQVRSSILPRVTHTVAGEAPFCR